MLIPVLFHSFTQASPSPIATLLLSAPSFIGDIYNTGVPEQFQTLFGPLFSPLLPPRLPRCLLCPPHHHLASHRALTPVSHPCTPSPHPRTLSINLFIFRSKSVSLKSVTLRCALCTQLNCSQFSQCEDTLSDSDSDSEFHEIVFSLYRGIKIWNDWLCFSQLPREFCFRVSARDRTWFVRVLFNIAFNNLSLFLRETIVSDAPSIRNFSVCVFFFYTIID